MCNTILIIYSIVSVLLVFFLFSELSRMVWIFVWGSRAEGIVSDISIDVRSKTRKGITRTYSIYEYTITFQTPAGETRVFRQMEGDNLWHKGEKVQILYLPNKATMNYARTPYLWKEVMESLVFVSIFCAPIVLLIFVRCRIYNLI